MAYPAMDDSEALTNDNAEKRLGTLEKHSQCVLNVLQCEQG